MNECIVVQFLLTHGVHVQYKPEWLSGETAHFHFRENKYRYCICLTKFSVTAIHISVS